MRQRKQWRVLPGPDPDLAEIFPPIPNSIARVLYHRGITDASAARVFLSEDAGASPDPFRMADMDRAVDRVNRAISAREPIVIYGDYDTDGVTATAMLVDFLASRGASVTPYIPNRFEEGYGLNCSAIQSLAGQGARVVISVDCGARSVDEAEAARSFGMDLIITDHHAPGDEVPPAFAFLDPKRKDCPYPDKDLAGVGVAYRLAQGLAARSTSRMDPPPEDFLDLVAIGTVADMAPLAGENRDLVRSGLRALNRPAPAKMRLGIDQLLQVAGIRRGTVTATAIGFLLGPRLNAAGRMDTAVGALDLLLARDDREAQGLASLLDARNRERQALTRKTFLEAKEIIVSRQNAAGGDLPYFLMAQKDTFNPGVIGLAASKLMEEFYRPSAVVAVEGEISRGSLRSIPGFHITEALDACSALLERYGGHAAAAGFSIRTERLEELHQRLENLAREALGTTLLLPTIAIDAEIRLSDLNWELLDWLGKLEPTGQGNSAPVFAVRRVQIGSKRSVGKDNGHLKIRFTDGASSIDAIGFGMGPMIEELPSVVDVAFALEENDYYGRHLQMRIIDILAPGGTTLASSH